MTLRTVCLGNPKPRNYKTNPVPSAASSIEELREFAAVLKVDVSNCIKTGDEVRAGNGVVLYVADAGHERASLMDAIAAPVEIPYNGPKACTKIQFSPDSSLAQAVAEAQTIWSAHGTGSPTWIAGNNATLVSVLAEHFGITEVRELEQDAS